MSINVNNGYEQFYKGTEPIKNYGSDTNRKNKLVRYEFNTTDEKGNKIMDKMSREETLQAMKDIRSQYGDDVVIEFSGDGMAALVESKKSGHGVDLDTLREKAPDVCNELDDLMQQILEHGLNHNGDGEKFGAKFIDLVTKAEKAILSHDAKKEKSYLSKKYNNYSIVSVNYSKGMRYGSNATTNVAISPQFLAKMAGNPELEKEYEGYLADMQELDAQEDRLQAAKGWHVVARGWAIDKDGGISKWGIVEKDNKKSHLQTMSENAEKIRKQNEEKKQEKGELEEKRRAGREEKEKLQEKLDEAGKARFDDKWKGAIVINKDDEKAAVPKADKDNEAVTGLNMDLKV